MRTYDKIPETMPGEVFPMGDVTDVHKIKRAQEWFDEVGCYSSRKFEEYVRSECAPTDNDHFNARSTNHHALILCETWDVEHSDLDDIVTMGYMTGCAFMRKTGFLPDFDMDLQGAIAKMKAETNPQVFADNAWAGMARSHPNVFSQYEKLFELGRDRFDLELEGDDVQFIAGLALSYMLSVTAWLEKDVKISKFTSMVNSQETKHDLRTTDFRALFSTKPRLASNVPAKRLLK